jgi:hypothetical protein
VTAGAKAQVTFQKERDGVAVNEKARVGRLILAFAIGIVGCLVLIDLWARPDLYQGDLRAYYYAGKAFASGQDPYSPGVLSSLAGTPILNGFVYPPITLPAFRLLSELPYPAMYHFMLVAKVLLLVLLFTIWSREFLLGLPLSFILFAGLAFNASVYVDLRVGNLSIMEQAAIWLGFSFFLRKRLVPYALLILLVSLLKITPILLLLLILFSEDSRRGVYFGVSLALFVGLQLVSLALAPGLFRGFLMASSSLKDHGVVNPSTFGFIQQSLDTLKGHVAGSVIDAASMAIYAVLSAGVALITHRAMRSLSDLPLRRKLMLSICLFCLTYGLIVPRFKTYSYIIVLAPGYFVLIQFGKHLLLGHRGSALRKWLPLVAVGVLSSIYALAHGTTTVESSFLGYTPLLALAILWVLLTTGIGIHERGWLHSRIQEHSESGPRAVMGSTG